MLGSSSLVGLRIDEEAEHFYPAPHACCPSRSRREYSEEDLAHVAHALRVREQWLQRAMAEAEAKAEAEEAAAEEAAMVNAQLSGAIFENEGVLMQILSFCDVPTLGTCACVCRQWSESVEGDLLWLPLCRAQRADKAERFRINDDETGEARRACIRSSESFRGWRAEYRAAEERARRDRLNENELPAFRFTFTFKRKTLSFSDSPTSTSTLCFSLDGKTLGHPSGIRFPWRLTDGGRAVVVGPPEETFLTFKVSRLPDWSWKLENTNILLLEQGSTAHQDYADCDDSDRVCHEDSCSSASEGGNQYVAVVVDGDVYWVDIDDVPLLEGSSATIIG
mmetsp:Transcript_15798/g.47931  ORF Transcript_15798/g.47931 Transcript_15798/m.47931 type:complete len:336 (+) Transcript_15798:161-1168(+)|eukprot:scaffold31822_cov26-Tisochrysis_lutea.AAC.1